MALNLKEYVRESVIKYMTELRSKVYTRTEIDASQDAQNATNLNLVGYATPTTDPGAIAVSSSIQDAIKVLEFKVGSVNTDALSNVASNVIIGRVDVGTGLSEELTPLQVRNMLNIEDGASADMTSAEIKSAYELNANTNAFTDLEKTKLSNVLLSTTSIRANGTADNLKVSTEKAVRDAIVANNLLYQPLTSKDQPDGYAGLDASGKVPVSLLPSSVTGGMKYIGAWNASTNSPNISTSSPLAGHYYIVSIAGNTLLDGDTDWQTNDWAVFNGTTWDKIDNSQAQQVVQGIDIVGNFSNILTAEAITDLTTAGF